MKLIDKYKELNILSEDHSFQYLINNMIDTIHSYDFFVAWNKVLKNVSDIEVSLNILNTLIGKDDIQGKLKELINKYPEIVSVIPILIAVREKTIIISELGKNIEYSFITSKKYTEKEIDDIVLFCDKCGLLKILQDKNIKNLVDYCVGVEVGLDTNARKNRSGTAMENLAEIYVKNICNKYKYRYLTQATVSKIKDTFNQIIPTDKSDRAFDFVINTGSKIYILEVNYYSGGGSKLKSVAGEFKSLYSLIKTQKNVEFIWVTDGKGWNTAKQPLLETFNAINYIINIKLIENGLLEEILTKGL
ncbi:MAG: type II restriction endonuclease [Endomicrobiaceae bacterium]|nr:type II restriction endonuclease [Endomicrobiaceae bacterium]